MKGKSKRNEISHFPSSIFLFIFLAPKKERMLRHETKRSELLPLILFIFHSTVVGGFRFSGSEQMEVNKVEDRLEH